EHFFGAALAKALSDRDLFDDLAAIQVCSKLLMAELRWGGTGRRASSFFYAERTRTGEEITAWTEPTGMHRVAILPIDPVKWLFDATHPPEHVTSAQARKRIKVH